MPDFLRLDSSELGIRLRPHPPLARNPTGHEAADRDGAARPLVLGGLGRTSRDRLAILTEHLAKRRPPATNVRQLDQVSEGAASTRDAGQMAHCNDTDVMNEGILISLRSSNPQRADPLVIGIEFRSTLGVQFNAPGARTPGKLPARVWIVPNSIANKLDNPRRGSRTHFVMFFRES